MGNDCCSNNALDSLCEVSTSRLRPCDSQQIGNTMYHSDQIYKIIRLQKRVRQFVQRKRAIQQYLEACPTLATSPEFQTDIVVEILGKYGPFVYSSE